MSTRTDRTTLFRLSTNDETCEMFNNVIYTSEPGETLSLSNDAGVLNVRHNWIKSGWVRGFDVLTGHAVTREYLKHQQSRKRVVRGKVDLGAFEAKRVD